MLGKPVGTTITLSPFARVLSVALNGSTSLSLEAELVDATVAVAADDCARPRVGRRIREASTGENERITSRERRNVKGITLTDCTVLD
jgi:hypothetical protein